MNVSNMERTTQKFDRVLNSIRSQIVLCDPSSNLIFGVITDLYKKFSDANRFISVFILMQMKEQQKVSKATSVLKRSAFRL